MVSPGGGLRCGLLRLADARRGDKPEAGWASNPVPLSADEVNQILYRQATSAERPRPKLSFEKSETVKIVDGPFANFSGKVDEVNTDRGTLRVMVTIFGRATPVELEFLQVEKV